MSPTKVILSVLILSAMYSATVLPPSSKSAAGGIISAINAARAQRSLSNFSSAAALESAAATQASYCSSTSTLTHTGEGGSSVGDRAASAGYAGGSTGEVLAMGGAGTADAVVGMWEGSPTHWEILMGDYIEVGCAESGEYYACVVGSA
mmetsp:Transcript_23758/g.59053  ORF Transcript_23758/g.59053 Transcript_23758/m.59053 type:complete len:149 (+) Transcript_23758:316-762(+)|eukprot:CAMPEP_0174893402 /NCGR_PEP_ID=MMETSP0167-20121228/8234_1 /TAXON_ID=38298 /ORGANISM="Rhodella maculata, Strain CCMP736" /LENGTH=148 /DNA_ID=CAMNT_0016132185 /DNA_START=294 /DNA_END=740 /DNA_ORIENTATION=-